MEATDAGVITASLADPRAFAAIYDRHAARLFRFLIRRVGRDTADDLLGETFRIAFERREAFDTSYANARPWLYGIASNLLNRHRRTEGRRLHAIAQLEHQESESLADAVIASVDAARHWPRVIDRVVALPDGERDALLLFAWEGLSYDDISVALGIPVGTVRSRLNRARTRVRELVTLTGQQLTEANDPWTLRQERDRLMSSIEHTALQPNSAWRPPAIYPRLGYLDEHAALEFLTRAFGFRERREARMGGETPAEKMLAWL
jgi:RNA polymerase sigma-70 factor (ECF subfamily)